MRRQTFHNVSVWRTGGNCFEPFDEAMWIPKFVRFRLEWAVQALGGDVKWPSLGLGHFEFIKKWVEYIKVGEKIFDLFEKQGEKAIRLELKERGRRYENRSIERKNGRRKPR